MCRFTVIFNFSVSFSSFRQLFSNKYTLPLCCDFLKLFSSFPPVRLSVLQTCISIVSCRQWMDVLSVYFLKVLCTLETCLVFYIPLHHILFTRPALLLVPPLCAQQKINFSHFASRISVFFFHMFHCITSTFTVTLHDDGIRWKVMRSLKKDSSWGGNKCPEEISLQSVILFLRYFTPNNKSLGGTSAKTRRIPKLGGIFRLGNFNF